MAGRRRLHHAAPMAPERPDRDDPHRGEAPHRDAGSHGDGDAHRVDDVLEAVLGLDEDQEPVRRIADVSPRTPCDVEGEVASVGRATGPTVALDVVLTDGTGHLLCHFFGRDAIPGVTVGTRLRVAGRVVTYRSRRCLVNPAYEFVAGASSEADSS